MLEQREVNQGDLDRVIQIVELAQQTNCLKAAEMLTAQGQPIGRTVVTQTKNAYEQIYLKYPIIASLYLSGLLSWGQIYNRAKKIRGIGTIKDLCELAIKHHPEFNFGSFQHLMPNGVSILQKQ